VNYLLHGATLALAWFFATNVAASAAVAIVTNRANRANGARYARRSALLLLLLRLLPSAASVLFVALVFVPSYWKFEPREFTEGFDLTLTLAAAAACALSVSAFVQGAIAWRRAMGRARAWTQTAEPLAVDGLGIPAFRVEAEQPVMALVGIVRSRLLVTRGLIDALTPEELAVSIAHEIGHHRAWDNLKRLAMRGAPDLLGWMPAARRLEHAWAAAAEHTADAGASASADRAARFALASALVKIARLMPPPPSFAEPISTLVGDGEIASRVRRLIDEAPPRDAASRPASPARLALAVAAAVSLALAYAPLLATVHRATEVLVHHLP
jgi:Zn-dependent protease with chaperone function